MNGSELGTLALQCHTDRMDAKERKWLILPTHYGILMHADEKGQDSNVISVISERATPRWLLPISFLPIRVRGC